MHVFTYGTLMFQEVWRSVAGRDFPAIAGTARGYAIYRVQDAVFPGIVETTANDYVEGVVYLDVDEDAVDRLDRFEDEFYVRQSLAVECEDGASRTADAYVVPEKNRSVLTAEPWRRDAFVASGGLDHFIRRFAGFARIDGAE
jgi:gamma-glutamylcyclotransferase (GGCT)/AIG2-like uncharacterized protein YtfP